jgi:hypothetical protein
MKKLVKSSILFVVMVSLVFGVFACAKDSSPKALAKEAFALMEQIQANPDSEKEAAFEKKMDALQTKVEKLSIADQAIFAQEYSKFMEEFLKKSLGGLNLDLDNLEGMEEDVLRAIQEMNQ